MLETRLSGEDHHVDQPGSERAPAAIHDFGVTCRACRNMAAEIGYAAVGDQDAAKLIEARGRIDEPRIDEGNMAGARALI
jgi:hypothetical protein